MAILYEKEKETAREYAYRVIKSNIISLELIPGSKVSENELASQLKISRTPVREALIELSKLKIVEIYPQRGSYISLIDSKVVDEARIVRLVLEKSLVEMLCSQEKELDLSFLEENVKAQEYYLKKPDGDIQLQLDNEFHKLLFELNSMTFTYSLLSGMMIHFDRARALSSMVIKDSKNVSDHIELLNAIKNKDSVLGRKIITKHLTRYKFNETVLRQEYPDYFK